jgi:phage gp29-like protein
VAKKRRPSATDRTLELPVISVFRQYSKAAQIASVMREHDFGTFSRSAGLVDEALTDDRIAGVSEQRVAAIKAAPFTVEPAGERRIERKRAEELGGNDKQRGLWRSIVSNETLGELLMWGWWLGFAYAKIDWVREPRMWMPRLAIWHPKWARWDWEARRFVVQTQTGASESLPRPDLEPRGDGKWFLWCPYGVQYGWMRAVIRSLADSYISRSWTKRDWDRYVERQALAIMLMKVPSSALNEDKLAVFNQLNNLGSEAAVMLPQASTKDGVSYSLEKLEFEARTWEAMKARKEALDTDIAIRILGQNLSTEVKEGSFAAAQTHNLVRLDRAIADAQIGPALRAQVLTWWAEYNYGDPELAPWPTFHVEPPEDETGEGQAMKAIGEGITALKTAEPRIDATAIIEEHGYPIKTEAEMAAAQEEQVDDELEPEDGLTEGEIISIEPEPTPEDLAEIQAQLAEQEGIEVALSSVVVVPPTGGRA